MDGKSTIDWPLLRKQKLTLLTVIDESAACRRPNRVDDLTGILQVIDDIQDTAVKTHKVPEEIVFGPESKE